MGRLFYVEGEVCVHQNGFLKIAHLTPRYLVFFAEHVERIGTDSPFLQRFNIQNDTLCNSNKDINQTTPLEL